MLGNGTRALRRFGRGAGRGFLVEAENDVARLRGSGAPAYMLREAQAQAELEALRRENRSYRDLLVEEFLGEIHDPKKGPMTVEHARGYLRKILRDARANARQDGRGAGAPRAGEGGRMSTDIRIESHPNGYERLFIEGKDLAGNPNGIDAWTVLHYLRWWHGYDLDVRKDFFDAEGNVLVTLDDGDPEAARIGEPKPAGDAPARAERARSGAGDREGEEG